MVIRDFVLNLPSDGKERPVGTPLWLQPVTAPIQVKRPIIEAPSDLKEGVAYGKIASTLGKYSAAWFLLFRSTAENKGCFSLKS